jgi:hypothetical protein
MQLACLDRSRGPFDHERKCFELVRSHAKGGTAVESTLCCTTLIALHVKRDEPAPESTPMNRRKRQGCRMIFQKIFLKKYSV